jgi:hypothetical protein
MEAGLRTSQKGIRRVTNSNPDVTSGVLNASIGALIAATDAPVSAELQITTVRNLTNVNGVKAPEYLGMSPRRGGAGLSPLHKL